MEKEKKKDLDKKYESVKVKALAAVALFGSGITLTGYILGGYITDTAQPIVKRIKSEKKQSTEIVKASRSVNYDKLKDFVETASIHSQTFDSIITELSKETFGMTEKQKFTLVYQSLLEDMVKVTDNNLPEKYSDERDYFVGEGSLGVYELSFDKFNKKYNYFFNTNADFEALSNYEYGKEESIGAPALYLVDFELGKIYFTNYNDEVVDKDRYLTKVFDYDSDDHFYYIYEYIAKYNDLSGFSRASVFEDVDVDEFYGNEQYFDVLVWKFDKDYNFVSTTYRR